MLSLSHSAAVLHSLLLQLRAADRTCTVPAALSGGLFLFSLFCALSNMSKQSGQASLPAADVAYHNNAFLCNYQ
jgi:hypothetical protein